MGKIKDLTGMRFGRLLVERFVGIVGRRPMWECRCDCGKRTRVVASNLGSGRTKSCGCGRIGPPIKDRTGKRYGRLVVEGLAGKVFHVSIWDCLCDCGKRLKVRASNLTSGHTRSCGCIEKERIIDMVGKKFGRFTVRKFIGSMRRQAHWECVCECGKVVTVSGRSLRSGVTKSCGCFHRDAVIKSGEARAIHGHNRKGKTTRTYKTWQSMIDRCSRVSGWHYHYYGSRGIKVCDRWKSFANFLKDMGERPLGLTIHRIDNDGNYQKENCKWATMSEQMKNRRDLGRRKRRKKGEI